MNCRSHWPFDHIINICLSDLNHPTPLDNNGLCFDPHLGCRVPEDIRTFIGLSDRIVNAVEVSLHVILVLHPVAAGLTLITFITSLFLASHAVSILTLFLTVVALGTVVFGIDLVLVIVAKNEIKNTGFLEVWEWGVDGACVRYSDMDGGCIAV